MSEVLSLDPKLRPETVAVLARLFASRRGEIIDVSHYTHYSGPGGL
jgi:hypothetical protein